MSVIKYLLVCFTDAQTSKEIFDFAVKAIRPQVDLLYVNLLIALSICLLYYSANKFIR